MRHANTETRSWPGDHSSGADARGTGVRFQFIHANQLQKQSHPWSPGETKEPRLCTRCPSQHSQPGSKSLRNTKAQKTRATLQKPLVDSAQTTHTPGRQWDGTVPLKVCLGHGAETPKSGQKQGNQTEIPELKGPVSTMERGLNGLDSGRRRGQ